MNRLFYLVVLFSLFIIPFSFSACSVPKPSGTYKSEKSLNMSLTFTNDTLLIQDSSGKKYTYKYEIKDNGTKIEMVEVEGKSKYSESFAYVKDIECVIIAGDKYFR
jgi:uncharacterized protein YxeA